ncbi:MAG: amino acid adenylation domain-containing protein [Cyanobacteria bacterium J06623_4]
MSYPTSPTVQDIYPLSPTQRGLLFHSLYERASDHNGIYIVQVSYTLQGNLNRAAFNQAWQQLMARHTILRTAFAWDKLDAPVQVVGQKVALPIYWQDWQHLSDREQEQKFSDLLTVDRQRGFNLSKAPLMRVSSIQTHSDCYRVLWTHHHILLDGWSLPILFKEWVACYRAACTQAADTLQTLLKTAHPYRDYIAWLQKQDLVAAKQFWRSHLAGISSPTPLGIDNTAPKASEPSQEQFKTQLLTLSDELSQQLKAFAQQHRLTLSNIVQGAWAKILSVYSSKATVMYGLARAGRSQDLAAANSRVGLFINTLPMRVNVEADKTLVPWLKEIQAQQLAQQPYEYTPLVEVQSVSDVPRQSPLFESVIVFENYPIEPAQDLAGLNLLDVSITEQTHYSLTLFAVATRALSFKLIYDAQRFSEDAIAHLLSHLHTTLANIINGPQQSLGALSILPSSERERLLKFGKGPTVARSHTTAQTMIAHQATQNPNATAVIFEGESLSYSQLNNQANQLARHIRSQLQQKSISPNQPIGLCIERSIDMIVSLLAILKAGCAYVPLDPTYPAARLKYTVENAGIRWIICQDSTAQKITFDSSLEQSAPQQINLDQQSEAIAAQPISAPAITSSPDDLAYLIYTSGSTGQPKGVPITHNSLSNLLNAMSTRLRVQPSDTLLAVTTLAFDIAALELFLPLISGAQLFLASQVTTRDSHQLIAYLDTFGIDIMQATPATWRLLLNSGWAGQSNLKILCGGEALDIDLARRLLHCAEEVWNVYGPTETTIWSSALELSPEMLTDGNVPIGHPIDNTQFYVLDAQQQPVPIGVAGELYIGGIGLSSGYWNREDLTSERFVQLTLSPSPPLPLPLYKTGDRVRYLPDGTLTYLGRLDYQTKLRGYRIELGEIESAITAHAWISQAVVIVQGDSPEAQYLAAYVTLRQKRDDADVVQELRSQLTRRLPHYMLPAIYHVLPSFPLTPNGKLDRKALEALQPPKADNAVEDARPQTTVETALLEIWTSLLPSGAVSIHDNFFEIGGHSLLVINAQSQIRRKLNVELSLVDLFRYPTLSSLAAHISNKLSATEEETGLPKDLPKARGIAMTAGKQRLKQRLKRRQATEPLGGAAK